jgi:hypothetical protein
VRGSPDLGPGRRESCRLRFQATAIPSRADHGRLLGIRLPSSRPPAAGVLQTSEGVFQTPIRDESIC